MSENESDDSISHSEEEVEKKEDINDEEEGEDDDKLAAQKPEDIKVKNQIFDCAFHPNKEILGIGEITGRVSLFSYSNTEKNKNLLEFKNHKKACRCLSFSMDGKKLYSASKDKSVCVVDMNNGAVIKHLMKAHQNPVSSMKVLSNDIFATGCDEGVVKIWDARTYEVISEYSNRKEYISDMASGKDGRYLLCTSGDGVLSVYNLRKKKLEKESDQLDEELINLEVIKHGEKVVCGSGSGVLNIYSWGEWGDISDRFPTKFQSIESMCAVNEDIVCIGSDDGLVKAMHILPHKEIRKLGKHGDFGISRLKLSLDKQLMASCGNENTVKFWNVSSLHEVALKAEERKGVKRRHAESTNDAAEFFADL